MKAALLAVAALLGAVSMALAAVDPVDPGASAEALVVRLAVPGLAEETSPLLAAPPEASLDSPFAVPADGSAVRVGSSSSEVLATPGTSGNGQASITALGVSILGGEVTAESISLRASAVAGASGASADASVSSVTGLAVLGQPVAAAPNLHIPIADWGSLRVLTSTATVADGKPPSASAAATGLRVELAADHGGFPAGTVIEVGSVTVSATAAEIPPTAASETPRPRAPDDRPAFVPVPRRVPGEAYEQGRSIPGAPVELVRPAPDVVARLSLAGYVFPVFGPASFGDSFGAFRADVAGKWHHGEDIVAPMGTPLLAVADGTVFSVGWNELGGWRLWLRDDQGNEFYYAHMSAYSPLAVDGRRVKAGDVLGFVGDSGDADGGIPHVHFEIHPAELLSFGYDGVVAPYPFLVAWRRAEDVSFEAGRRFVPAADGRPGVGPRPAGAYVLEMSDVGTASGLVPGALERALDGPAAAKRPS